MCSIVLFTFSRVALIMSHHPPMFLLHRVEIQDKEGEDQPGEEDPERQAVRMDETQAGLVFYGMKCIDRPGKRIIKIPVQRLQENNCNGC